MSKKNDKKDRRKDAILSGGNRLSEIFFAGELSIIGVLTAILRGKRMQKRRYAELEKAQVQQEFHRAVNALCDQVQNSASKIAEQALVEGYQAAADEIEMFADSLELQAQDMQEQIDQTVKTLMEELSATFQVELRYMRRDADDLYRTIIETVRDNREATGKTLNKAVSEAMQTFAQKGIIGFVDAAGRNWGLYEYTNMAMRTAIHRAGLKATLENMGRYGLDLAFVTRHPGACPLCAKWYGVIFSVSGQSISHPSLQDAMDAGLFHPNCADILQVYIEGVSDLENGMVGFDAKESAERYVSSQRQRLLERQVRRWKRIQAASINPEEERIAKAHVDKYQRQIRILTEGTKLPRRYDREGGRVLLSEAAKKLRPFTISDLRTASGAMSAIRNTGKQVYFNPQAGYRVNLDGYSDTVNAGISKAIRNVAMQGSESRTEHMYLVNLKTGDLDFYETNDEFSSVGYAFRDYLVNHPDKQFAFVHNHNTDSSFSETDVVTLLTFPKIPVMIAARNDGIIYVAERAGPPLAF